VGSHYDIIVQNDLSATRERAGERGSARLLVLIALLLCAALFYAVMQTTSEGQGTGPVDRTLFNASRVTQFPTAVRFGVTKMINAGITPDKLDFTADGVSETQGSGVFVETEGGITLQGPPPGTGTKWVFTAENELPGIGTGGRADILAVMPGLSAELCAAINANLVGANFIPPLTTRIKHETTYDGSGFPEQPNLPGSARGDLNAQRFMCVSQPPLEGVEPEFIYYHTLVEN